MTISENGVSFFGSGGHSHNGVNSTIIDVGSYSLFDFSLGYIGSQTRINRQSVNQTALEDWIIRLVNSKVLQPSGIDLSPNTLNGKVLRANTVTAVEIQANTITASEIAANTITANEIAANTITATEIAANTITSEELVANFVLVNTTISSNNYVTGISGWAIDSDGTAEFGDVTVRGTVGGWTVNSTSIYAGDTALYSNGTVVIGANLRVGDVVRINEPTGDGGITTLKVKGNANSNTTWSFRAQNKANTNHFGVRNDGEIFMAAISSDTGTTLVLNSSGYVQKSTSTIKIKENIEYISNSYIDLIKKLKPVKFTYKRNINDNDYTYSLKQLDKQIGFILEDIMEVESDFDGSLVSYQFSDPNYIESIAPRPPFSEEEDFNHIEPVMYKEIAIVAITVKALQSLIEKVEDLETRLQAIEGV